MFHAMPDDLPLRPATRDELRDALGYALRFNRRGKPHRHALEDIARIAADVLIEHLELSGFVVMKKPPAVSHAAPAAHRDRGAP
jgi:hypothetical protein